MLGGEPGNEVDLLDVPECELDVLGGTELGPGALALLNWMLESDELVVGELCPGLDSAVAPIWSKFVGSIGLSLCC